MQSIERELDIEEIIEEPLVNLSIPYTQSDYFELFHRLERLNQEIDRLLSVEFQHEETRVSKLKTARKAKDVIKRHTHSEEMNKRGYKLGRPSLGDQQQQLILDEILKRGSDPKSLPRKPGKIGSKKAIKDKLLLKQANVFSSEYAFDNAWKMMRKKKIIQDA